MKIVAFRIENYRSIIDTGWVRLSSDGVTVLVGQNESGKSSILSALAKTFSSQNITSDDIRFGAKLPVICVEVEYAPEAVDRLTQKVAPAVRSEVKTWFKERKHLVRWRFSWAQEGGSYEPTSEWEDSSLSTILTPEKSAESKEEDTEGDESAPSASDDSWMDYDDFTGEMFDESPAAILFDEASGLLPNRISIPGDYKLSGAGSTATRNFLAVVGVDLQQLVTADSRTRENILNRANRKITQEFQRFWTQRIGKVGRVEIQCRFEYGRTAPTAESPALVFFLSNGSTSLHPGQRSKGVTWFVSFFLQLAATDARKQRRFFLLDEPGANLHTAAQKDVLRLINEMRHRVDLIYSTHSPELVEYDGIHRVLAVERDEGEDNPTVIVPSHRLGAASTDTLSAVLRCMGANFAQQEVIQKRDNVILEEISGFHYMRAIWKLFKLTQPAHFFAATGVGNVPLYVTLFIGWGLEFVAMVDDDNHGRQIYNQLKRDIYLNDEDLASKYLLKLPAGPCIEDIFTKKDFVTFVLRDPTITYAVPNSEYVKEAKRAKGLDALEFRRRVEAKELKASDLEDETVERMKAVTAALCSRLSRR